jgi:cytochrome c5
VDVQKHDKTFVATFLAVLGALVAFTIAISFIAGFVSAGNKDEAAERARVEERIRPVGEVITDEKALLAATPAPAAAAAPRAPLSGAEVVARACAACHTTGVLAAPKTGDKAAWTARGDLNTLVASAIKGKNAMPPKGGDPSLSDAEIKAAVQEMMK